MSDWEGVDAVCRSMMAPWAIEGGEGATAMKGGGAGARQQHRRCQWGWGCLRRSYYNGFSEAGESTSMPSGVYNLDKIKKWGKSRNWCPH